MPTPTYKNRVGQASATTGLSTLTLGSAESGYQALAAGDDGLYFDVVIEDGTAWEIARECLYTHSGTTLTRGTLEASSTGSAISLSGAQKVYVTRTAFRESQSTAAAVGYIAGLGLTYSSTTAVVVGAGKLDINGTLRDYAGGTFTSASTMKNMANSTVALGASKAYTVFAFYTAGAVDIRFEDRDGSGDGADCTFSTTLDYYHAATTGVEARKIGVLYTNASSQIIYFKYYIAGRERLMQTIQGAFFVTNGTATSFTSLTLTPWVYSDDLSMLIGVSGRRTATAGLLQPLVAIDGGTSNSINIRGYADVAATSITFGNQTVLNTGTLHYMLNGGNADCSLSLYGLGMCI